MSDADTLVQTDNDNGFTPGRIEGGDFGVTFDGAATYVIPLWVPPGRRGIQPALELRYHSRGGNGSVGVGWSLSGIPQITRCKKTVADDGAAGPIRFDHTDPFCLDAERLVLVGGVHGADGAEYRTTRDTFTKIILHDVDYAPDGHALGPTWFEAFYKDGRIFTFGGLGASDLGSRFEGTAQEFVPLPYPVATDQQVPDAVNVVHTLVRYAWSLCSIRDRSGNELRIYYDGYPPAEGATPGPRDYLPTQILYTGSPVDGTAALRTVDFVWEDRPDPQTRFMSGLRLLQKKRLKEVRMSGPDPVNPALLRRYALGYRNDSVSKRSLLSTVREFDRFGVAKRAHSLEWELGESTFRQIDTGITDVKTTPAGRSTLPGRLRVADFDGDGRDDILYVPTSHPDQFYILLADPSSPTGFAPPFPTGIPVPKDPAWGRPYIFRDTFSGFMNILILDDTQKYPLDPATYRVYQAGINRSGDPSHGALGSFGVFPGRVAFPVATDNYVLKEIVELADFDGDGLPDLLHGALTGDVPSWSVRTNLGGDLTFDVAQPVQPRLFPVDHYFANLDGDAATAILIDGPVPDPRYSAVQLRRQGGKLSSTVALTTLLRDQQYVFADFDGSGLPSAFGWGHSGMGDQPASDASVSQNVGGSFASPTPALWNFKQPPSRYVPLMRVMDWDEDGSAEFIVRDRTLSQKNDAVFLLKWTGSSFKQTTLRFTTTYLNTEEYNLFEVFDVNGDGLDDIIMFSDGSMQLFVREGNKADMMTAVIDGLGARTVITYASISDPKVHAADFGYVHPLRALVSTVWVVAEHRDDNGIGGVNTYRFHYKGGVEDVTGVGFLGFKECDALHVETGITTHTTYLPDFGIPFYPMLGLPIDEVTHTPLSSASEHVTTRHSNYAIRPKSNHAPFFVFPRTVVEEDVENSNGVPTMPVCRRTITQDRDKYGNTTQYSEVWSDGNRSSYTASFINEPGIWLIGLLNRTREQSTTPNGLTQTRNRAYEYDAQGLLSRVIIEPGRRKAGQKVPLPLGPQRDGVKTLFRSIDRYPNGTVYRIVDAETTAAVGVKRARTFVYDDLEHMFPTEIDDDLGHHLRATYHPGLAVTASLEDENGVTRVRQYDGFGRFRHETSPDGNDMTVHYADAITMRVTLDRAAGSQLLWDYDVLGRVVSETIYARDDGKATVRDVEYDGLGRTVRVSRPRFPADVPVFDTFAYDTLGRPTARARPDGTGSTTEYRGEWIITTDGNQNAVAVRVDNLDRVVFSTDRDAALVGSKVAPAGMTYEYGPFDTLGTVSDIVGNATAMTNDRLGRLIDWQDPDRGHRVYRYNAFGDLEQEIKGNNQVVHYHYDVLGRLYWVEDAVDGDVNYTWDMAANGVGKVAQIAVPVAGVTTTYTYDPVGRLITKAWTIGADTYALTTTFDSVGRLAGITYPQVGALKPFAVGYEYGNFGQLLRAFEAVSRHVYWQFMSSDASGAFGQAEFGNALFERSIEDPTRPGVLKSIETIDAKSDLLRKLVYGFDANLSVQLREDKILGTQETFEYDSFNRLHRWTWNGAAGARGTRWDYDDIGNLLLRAVEAGPGKDLAYAYDPATAGPHAVVSTTLGGYKYDPKGNQISAPGRTVTFGRQDLPTQIMRTVGKKKTLTPINFFYDGEMSRVRTIDETTKMTNDTLGGFYDFRRPSGNQGADGEHIFTVWVNTRPVARRTWNIVAKAVASDQIEYLHSDHQGSIDLITSVSGAVVERLKYDPFGQRVSATDPAKLLGSPKTDLYTGYTGQEHVDGWELVDMKGRFYDPVVGKFLTPDPFVPSPLTPQSWNRYAYVLNNPLSLRDPTGFDDGGDDEDGPLQSGETLWAPGVTTEEGCLADPACEALHVSHGGPDTPPPTPPQPPRNDDGLGGPGTVGPPINAGLRTQQSRDRRYGSIYPEGEHVALPRWPPGSYTIRSPQGYEYLQDRMLGWVGRDSLAAWTAMDALQSDPNRFFPFRVLGLNGERGIVLGGVYELTNRPGVTLPLPPGRFPVQVTVVTPTSFTFTALYGHFDAPGSTITFLMRTDAAGLFHFEQLGIGRSSESSISDYLYAPSVAAFAWTMQAENVRQWVFSTLSFTQVAP